MPNQRAISIFSAIFILATLTILLARNIYLRTSLDESAENLVLDVTQSILNSDSAEALTSRAFNGLVNQDPALEYQSQTGSIMRIMGTLNSITSIAGSTDIEFLPFTGNDPTAHYELAVDFQRGSASIATDLIYKENQWWFTHFDIDADQLQN